eukprot:g799.t1
MQTRRVLYEATVLNVVLYGISMWHVKEYGITTRSTLRKCGLKTMDTYLAVRRLRCGQFLRLRSELRRTGKVVVRNAPVRDLSEVSTVAAAVWGEEQGIMDEYTHGSTTRDQLGNGVLQVNLEPPEAPVLAHTEMTYLDHFPTHIAFFVKVPARVGGKTTVTDNLAITRALSKAGEHWALGDKLRRLGVEFSRYLSCEKQTDSKGRDPLQYKTWQDAFSTCERAAAEQSVAQSVHEANVKSLADAGLLPYHSRWGDGSEFSSEEMAVFWDLVVLDNFRWCHGRTPYEGKRELYVAMSQPVARSTSCYFSEMQQAA